MKWVLQELSALAHLLSIIHDSQDDTEATWVSIGRWMDKESVAQVWNGWPNSALKKKEDSVIVTTWMNLEGFTLREVSQAQKDKYYVISLICEI
jgi:hypothetical protein